MQIQVTIEPIYVGAAKLDVSQSFDRFSTWLDDGMGAGMDYLLRHKELRRDPVNLQHNANVAIVFALNYWSAEDAEAVSDIRSSDFPRIAMYARYRDYHKTMRSQCKKIADIFVNKSWIDRDYRVCVDSAPLLERALAEGCRSNGFIGKNTMYIDRRIGSFHTLSVLLAHAEESGLTEIDKFFAEQTKTIETKASREKNMKTDCGPCRRCEVYCPTGALANNKLDARKCISYWTIEHRGEIPQEKWHYLRDYIFGCDICQLVCPFNKPTRMQNYSVSKAKLEKAVDPFKIVEMDEDEFLRVFAGTPVMRAKREGLVRNALICMYVRGDKRLNQALETAMDSRQPDVVQKTAQSILSLVTD